MVVHANEGFGGDGFHGGTGFPPPDGGGSLYRFCIHSGLRKFFALILNPDLEP